MLPRVGEEDESTFFVHYYAFRATFSGKSPNSIVVGCLLARKFSETRRVSSFSFADLFEEIIQVLTRLIVDASRAEKKSHEAFEARQRLLARLSPHMGKCSHL